MSIPDAHNAYCSMSSYATSAIVRFAPLVRLCMWDADRKLLLLFYALVATTFDSVGAEGLMIVSTVLTNAILEPFILSQWS